MLLALFEIFFRVLKQCTQSGVQAQQAQGISLGAAMSCLGTLLGTAISCHVMSAERCVMMLSCPNLILPGP